MAKNLLLKDGVPVKYGCTLGQLQDDFLDAGVFVTMDADLPYERADRDGSIFLLLTPKAVARPAADKVKEIDPVLVGREWVQAYESRDFTVAEIDAHRNRAKARLISKQTHHANKGIIVRGIRIGTTPDALADLTPDRARKVNLPGGRTTLTVAQLLSIADLVKDHRQGCQDKGFDISETLDGLTTKTAIDDLMNDDAIMSGWPGDTP